MHPFSFPKPVLLFCWAFSLLSFGVGFGISYRQDKLRVVETGQLAWLHLLYAEQLNDDMAVIDWSNNLEKIEGVLAFQAANDSKVTAEGGNRNFLPTNKTEGVSYWFPASWIFYVASSKPPQNMMKFTLLYCTWPGPLLWGLFTFFICLAAGIGTSWISAALFPEKVFNLVPPGPISKPKPLSPPIRPQNSSSSSPERPFLFLDKNYVIQQVTPEAAKLLQKNSADLLYGHLIDLAPEPSLMQAIEKGEESKLLRPFSSYPRLSVSLKPDPNGTLLFLESTE